MLSLSKVSVVVPFLLVAALASPGLAQCGSAGDDQAVVESATCNASAACGPIGCEPDAGLNKVIQVTKGGACGTGEAVIVRRPAAGNPAAVVCCPDCCPQNASPCCPPQPAVCGPTPRGDCCPEQMDDCCPPGAPNKRIQIIRSPLGACGVDAACAGESVICGPQGPSSCGAHCGSPALGTCGSAGSAQKLAVLIRSLLDSSGTATSCGESAATCTIQSASDCRPGPSRGCCPPSQQAKPLVIIRSAAGCTPCGSGDRCTPGQPCVKLVQAKADMSRVAGVAAGSAATCGHGCGSGYSTDQPACGPGNPASCGPKRVPSTHNCAGAH